jgi:intersectin
LNFFLQVPLEQHGEVGWLAGEIGGHTGWFPETYVEKLDEGELNLHGPAAAVEPTPLE